VTDEGWVTIEKLLGIDNIADAETGSEALRRDRD